MDDLSTLARRLVGDLNAALANRVTRLSFAYESLSAETRNEAGDLESFERVVLGYLKETIASGLQSESHAKTCTRCGKETECIDVPRKYSPDPSSCQARCECGASLSRNCERLMPALRFDRPHIEIVRLRRHSRGDRGELQVTVAAMYADTGLSRTAFVTNRMIVSVPVRRIDDRWLVAGVPAITHERVTKRWMELPRRVL